MTNEIRSTKFKIRNEETAFFAFVSNFVLGISSLEFRHSFVIRGFVLRHFVLALAVTHFTI
jgi:hypothetical protein